VLGNGFRHRLFEKREKGRTPSYFVSMFKDNLRCTFRVDVAHPPRSGAPPVISVDARKTALYFPVKVAHPPSFFFVFIAVNGFFTASKREKGRTPFSSLPT
jgi:hypothetical protein